MQRAQARPLHAAPRTHALLRATAPAPRTLAPGYLAHHRNTAASTAGFWDDADAVAPTVQQAAAASVAARGLLFANAHPAPSSWRPVCGPTCGLPERAARENLEELSLAARRSHLALGGARCGALAGDPSTVAARSLPFLRALCENPGPRSAALAAAMPARWTYVWQGALSRREAHGAGAGAAEAEAAALAASLAAAGLVDGGGGGTGEAGEEGIDEIEED
jgi:hypothetical protein